MTTAQPQSTTPCVICGAHTLTPRTEQLTRKRRVKFGAVWILVTLLSLGLGFIGYLIWPRKTEVIGVDRWLECSTCGARRP